MKSGRLLPPEKSGDEVIRGTEKDPTLRAVPDARIVACQPNGYLHCRALVVPFVT